MRQVKGSERFARRTLIFCIILLVFVAILGMHYGSKGLMLCSKLSTHVQVVPAPTPVVLLKPMLPFARATDIAEYLEKKKAKIGVELGVQAGAFSEKILKSWISCEKYYLVDVWKTQRNYRDFSNVNDAAQEQILRQAKKSLARWRDTTTFIRDDTLNAASKIKEMLDFIYIDARHDYCAVSAEIEEYWPKLKAGGIMAGNAYASEGPPGADWSVCEDGKKHEGGVKAAVDEFVTSNNLHLLVTYQDSPFPTWVVQKHKAQPDEEEEDLEGDNEEEEK